MGNYLSMWDVGLATFLACSLSASIEKCADTSEERLTNKIENVKMELASIIEMEIKSAKEEVVRHIKNYDGESFQIKGKTYSCVPAEREY